MTSLPWEELKKSSKCPAKVYPAGDLYIKMQNVRSISYRFIEESDVAFDE